jgi:ATP-dependent protease HslVU (ClpYQ) peptidase subunit
MSVIVAIKEKDRIYVGCDSQVTTGWGKSTLTNSNNYKIFKPKKEKDVIIGVCGHLRDRDILYCIDEYIEELIKLKNEFDYKYVVKKIVPKIFSELESKNRIIKDDKVLKEMNNQILFAYKESLFSIGYDGSVIEIDDFCAIGSGQDFAIGFLNEDSEKSSQEKIIKAIKSSCKSDLYVNYPIVVMNTIDDVVEIIR